MRIDDNLNLVFPIRTETIEEGKITKEIPLIYAFHSPITREVYEANYRIMALAKSVIYAKGIQFAVGTGPLIASLVLKEEAHRDAEERGIPDPDLASRAFLAEIKRLTMIVGPSDNGFKPLPVDAALSSGMIDADEWREAESQLVFFSVTSYLVKQSKKKMAMDSAAFFLGGGLVSSNCTEWAVFSPTSSPSAPGLLGAVSSEKR
ncbi:MAG: hypothetical protein GJU73_06410 [Ferrovum sp.]|jgi:hypothetical protein|uniref:hypothetical protein n=1 Tax=Ferrovum sp. TaxID=2609467 RepID=UPI0026088CF3|nr:hypothetical protein [Ferrovum sp.]MBW8067065.1 hypothetical protein [Ferrovum sp.]